MRLRATRAESIPKTGSTPKPEPPPTAVISEESLSGRIEAPPEGGGAFRIANRQLSVLGTTPDSTLQALDDAARLLGATTSIPIVVGVAGDLLGTGAVKSLVQPGGNVTGMTLVMPELDRKRLEVLKD